MLQCTKQILTGAVMNKRKFIGDKAFYRRVFAIMLPILIQNTITNFVGLLDNIMVGQVGTEQMSGVAIVNQLLFVFNLCIFGGLAGAGILTSQLFGKGDIKGVRDTMRAKLYIAVGASALFAVIFFLLGGELISLFLHDTGNEELDLAKTLYYGKKYLAIMLFQLLPFAITNMYAGTLRETGETVLPMKAGVAAVFVNLGLNYLLIYGKLGLPKLGVEGAAIATVIARFAESAIVIVWTHRNKERNPFAVGVYRSLRVPKETVKRIAIFGAPLLMNEVLYSTGMTMLNQCYSLRGVAVVAALNISTTVTNLFLCACFAMGNTISIMIGQLLGAGKLERAVDEDRKLITFSFLLCAGLGAVMALCSPLFPMMYNTTEEVKYIATQLLLVSAVMVPFHAFTNACYFTLRSGGKTFITFLFDSAFIWAVYVPVAAVLANFTDIPILWLYLSVQALEILRCGLGLVFVKSRSWVCDLTVQVKNEA